MNEDVKFQLPELPLYYFEIKYEIKEDMELPPFNKGNIFRGAFGESLREMFCHDKNIKCLECKSDNECVYKSIFSPGLPEDSIKLSKMTDIPRGFIFHYPLDTKTIYKKGEKLIFFMSLTGKIIEYLHYIILVLNKIGLNGIGRRRAGMELESVFQLNPFNEIKETIFENKDKLIKPKNVYFNINSINDFDLNNISIKFLTPTRIVEKSSVVSLPDFSAFIKRLRDRYFALNLFYNPEYKEVEFNHKEFGTTSENIKTMQCNTRFIFQSRKARTQNYNEQDISGFVGTARFSGEITPFYKLLAIGQYIGVGKGTAFGFGRYVIEVGK